MRHRQQEAARRAFPESVDLLAVCVEAGSSLQAALAQVADNADDILAGQWRHVIADIRLGASQTEALESLAARVPVAEIRQFAATVVQAQELGLPLGPVLRAQAEHARMARKLRITEAAYRIPVLVLFPLVLCLLPALVAIIVGPAALTIIDELGSM